MKNGIVAALYVALMIATIVAIDAWFLRGRPWLRLAANVWIVLIFATFYFRFLRRP